MIPVVRAFGVASILWMTPFSVLVAGAQVVDPGLSLKISVEKAPPGAIAQIKLLVTEPKPITTGWADMSFDGFSDFAGFALGSGESAAVAVVQGSRFRIAVVSPDGTFGINPDYPVLTVAGRVRLDAPAGVPMPMTMDPIEFRDLAGALYPVEVKDGSLVAGGELSVSDVTPGSADLPAGATVSIFGSGFRPNTRVRLRETLLDEVRYVNEGQLDVVLAEPALMHGMRIRVRNPAGSEVTYYSYQRIGPSGSSGHPVLRDVVPIFLAQTLLQGSLPGATVGVAVQNPGATDAFLLADLVDDAGVQLATAIVEVPANHYLVRSLSEIFGASYGGAGSLRLVSDHPVQILGIDVDSSGGASPRLPQ